MSRPVVARDWFAIVAWALILLGCVAAYVVLGYGAWQLVGVLV